MAKFQLIDIIDESSKITKKNLNGLFATMESSESSVRKSLGIKEMFDDFDAGADPGEEEDDFRNAAGQGEFDDEDDMEGDELDMAGDEDMEGDELDMAGDEDMDASELDFDDNISDEEAREKHPDEYAAMVKSYDDQDMEGMDDPDEFDPEGGEKFDSDEFISRHGMGEGKNLSLIQMISRQVNEMGGNTRKAKRMMPKKQDFVVYENDGIYTQGRIVRTSKKSVKVKVNEREKTLGITNIVPGIKSKDDNFRARVREFKANHPSRNVWVVRS